MKATTAHIGRIALAGVLSCTLVFPLAGCGALMQRNAEKGLPSAPTSGGYSASDSMVKETEMGEGYYPMEEGYYEDPFNTEEYGMVREPGFVAVATNPLSTVSADVDTASYCNLRRMIYQGYAADEIPSGAVRIEEMLNYFTYNYATPAGDDLFAVTATAADCPWNPDTKLLVLGFATPSEASLENAGRNLVFLVDCSGSMDEADKLPLLKQAFSVLVDDLDENDVVSIVTYAGEERVLLDGVKGTQRRAITAAMRSIRADGCTNGQAGLAMAYQIAADHYIEGGVNRIIMASDGDLNVGITSESDLHDYVADMRDQGIYLSVLGFGSGNYKDTKMETLADNGNGQYHYIDCVEEAQRVFGENLSANLVPLADDVKIQVEFNPAQVKGYRLIGYENRAMSESDFENVAADAGDVGPNAQFTVAYEVVLADSPMDVPAADLKYSQGAKQPTSTSQEWATVTMRYKPVSGGNAQQQAVVGASNYTAAPDADWSFAASVIEFGMLLRESEYAGTASLESVLGLAERSSFDDARQEFMGLVDYLAGSWAVCGTVDE